MPPRKDEDVCNSFDKICELTTSSQGGPKRPSVAHYKHGMTAILERSTGQEFEGVSGGNPLLLKAMDLIPG